MSEPKPRFVVDLPPTGPAFHNQFVKAFLF